MSAEERYTVDTPENIEFSYNIAGIGSRFLATIVDTLLLLLMQLIVATVMIVLISSVEPILGDGATSILVAVWLLLSFLFLWGFYTFFEIFWNGQSPGKRLVRLRTVREGGRPITFATSAIRNLVRLIDFLPGFYGLGVLTMFIDRRARRLGDLAAGTLVVKERAAVSLESLTRQTEALPLPPRPAGAPPPDLLPNLHVLTDTDYDLVQEFLRRRGQLAQQNRLNLGTQLAQGLGTRMGMQVQPNDHMLFLERVARDYRIHKQQMANPQPVE